MANKRRGRRGPKITANAVTEKDFSAHKTRGPEKPPQHVANPSVSRKVRFEGSYTFTTSAPFTAGYSPNDMSFQDQQDYATSGLRYTHMRVSKVEAWVSSAQIGAGSATGYPVSTTASIQDVSSAALFNDTATPGVDYAHVSVKLGLNDRIEWYAANATTPILFVLGIDVPQPTSILVFGSYTIDVTVDFR